MWTLRRLLFIACVALGVPAVASESLDVRITGIEGELLDNVKAQLGIAQLDKRKLPIPLPATDELETEITEAVVRRRHRAAAAEIRTALQPFGYYSPRIKSTLEKTDQQWVASYAIDAGEPTVIEKLDLGIEGEGRDNADLLEVLSATQLARGQRLQHSHYEDTKTALLKAALAAGFLDASHAQQSALVKCLRTSYTQRYQKAAEVGENNLIARRQIDRPESSVLVGDKQSVRLARCRRSPVRRGDTSGHLLQVKPGSGLLNGISMAGSTRLLSTDLLSIASMSRGSSLLAITRQHASHLHQVFRHLLSITRTARGIRTLVAVSDRREPMRTRFE